MNKDIRERKEMEALFADPRMSRQAWKSIGQAIAMQPAVKPVVITNKEGEETYNSMIERYSYNQLAEDLKSLAKSKREPTELEMILHCQMMRARTDTSAATFIRDTLGAKPIDESKADVTNIANPYESLTDDELEALAAYRQAKEQTDGKTE